MFRWLTHKLSRDRPPPDAALPRDPELTFAQGNDFAARGRLDEAIECYGLALKLRPDFAEAACNLGAALKERGRVVEAVPAYEHAVRLRPAMFEAHFNLGLAFQSLGEFSRAIPCFERAVALRPGSAEAKYALGYLCANEDRRGEALRLFSQAVALDPGYAEAHWGFAMTQLLAVCGPDDNPERGRAAFAAELERLERWFDTDRGDAGVRAVGSIAPFRLAYQDECNRDLLARHGVLCARIMAAWAKRESIGAPAVRAGGEPVRVAVVSRYFRRHSVWSAIVRGWFTNLDFRQFALSAFCTGPEQDTETLVARAHAARFEQGTKSLREWVDAILSEEPHVVIYPEVGMDPMTIRLASLRLAPVQIAAWGHPETTGLPTIDYYLSAEDLEPPQAQEHYTERLVRLPHLGCCMEPTGIEPAELKLEAWNLDPDLPLLVCPGTPFKYAPQDDGLLVEVAAKLGRCQLVFFSYRHAELSLRLKGRLETVFRRGGIDPDLHLRFLPWLDPAEFHGLLRRATIYLDTAGFSGFNSATQAVECGLPIVTLEGRFMRGRFASGILRRLGASELVAQSREEYVAHAIRLVQTRSFAQEMRVRIEKERGAIFGDLAPIRALEQLLIEATR